MTTLALLICCIALGQNSEGTFFPFFEPIQPPRAFHELIARQGATQRAPQNTKSALEASISDGIEWIKVDVRQTRDGHHILFHDSRLDLDTDLAGPVRDRTLMELRQADAGSKFASRFAGERILTLRDGLQLAKGRVNLYLDCKQVDHIQLAREVLDEGMGKQVVIFDSPQAIKTMRAQTENSIGLMTKWHPRFGLDPWISQISPDAVEIEAENVTPDICRQFHRRGIKVEANVLNDLDTPNVWDRVAVARVDWIQTGRSEELLARRLLQSAPRNRVKVAHHRGSSRYAPENTIKSLEKALALGADYIEFDIRTTKDGFFVLLHDRDLDRTTTGQGPVRERSAVEIAKLDAGSWFGREFQGTKVPSLDEFLAAAATTGISLYVDAKDITPQALAEALARHGLTDRTVVYQSATYLEKLRSIAPNLRRMPPLRDPSQLKVLADKVEPFAFDTNWTILSKDLIDRCHGLKIQVFSDSLGAHETITDYQRAIRHGVDVIQTDHPLRVLQAIESLEISSAKRP